MRFNKFPVFHFQADGDGGNTPPAAGDPDSKARLSQHEVNLMVGREKAAAAARVEEQWKAKYSTLEADHNKLKAEHEKAAGTIKELEPLKAIAEEHKALEGQVRDMTIETKLTALGCDPARAKHVRVLLDSEKALETIPDKDDGWKPIVEKAKTIFPIAFDAQKAAPSGGVPSGGKPPAGDKPPAKSYIDEERDRLLGKSK